MLLTWAAIATAVYYTFTPPASLFPQRLSLSLFVPGFLFLSMAMADGMRTLSRRLSLFLTPALALVFLATSGLLHSLPSDPHAFDKIAKTFETLNCLNLRPDAKVYASPSYNHVLTFYSGKPIQSVAPVRRTFLDSYPGEIVYIEQRFMWEFAAPSEEDIAAAQAEGAPLGADEVQALASRYAREQTRPYVREVHPPIEPLSPGAAKLMAQTRAFAEKLADIEQHEWEDLELPFFQGFEIRRASDLWQTFFYRLVDPEQRTGPMFNAANRLRVADAYFLPSAYTVIFYSPKPAEGISASRDKRTEQ